MTIDELRAHLDDYAANFCEDLRLFGRDLRFLAWLEAKRATASGEAALNAEAQAATAEMAPADTYQAPSEPAA